MSLSQLMSLEPIKNIVIENLNNKIAQIVASFEKEYRVYMFGSMQSARRFASGKRGAVIVGWRSTSQGERVIVEVPDEEAIKRNNKKREMIKRIQQAISEIS